MKTPITCLLETMASMSFTTEEKFKLNELRSRVSHIYCESDEILVSWLRARDLDIDRAEQMLRRHLIWRKNNEIDKLKDWRSPKCFFPVLQAGRDFDGCPVFILPIGKWELRSAIESGDIVPALRYIYQYLERVVSVCHTNGVYQGVTIFDFDGFGYRQIAHRTVLQGILEVLRVFEANFPETLKNAVVINAPKIFNVLFSLMKPLLHSRTLAKILIYNSDKRKWKEALLNIMGADQLPPYWGGTMSGKDEFCSDAWFYEPLPKYFMRKAASSSDQYGDEWYQLKIAAGETITLEYEGNERFDSSLRWAFNTEGYDIGFSIYFLKENEETESIFKLQRVNAHKEKQEGKLRLERPGKYVLTFDNSFSRSRAKTLNYSVTLTQVDATEIIQKNNNYSIQNKNNLEIEVT